MPSVLAIAAHPDDIEFVMAGTMLLLAKQGWDLHYLNVADGSKGSAVTGCEETARVRLIEAQQAANMLGAKFYPPIGRDMELAFDQPTLRRVAAVVRQAQPQIVLTHAPSDYMEDHENTCRLAVTAAFCYGMPNFETDPPTATYRGPVTIYHAQPHGNRTPMCEVVKPHFAVDIANVLEKKEASLACHASQKDWLDASQGMGSYIQTMRDLCSEVGRMSGKFAIAEGWRRRQHWGYCNLTDDPLRNALREHLVDVDPKF
jgi:N-acetylglucosamine malate deacetylase 1